MKFFFLLFFSVVSVSAQEILIDGTIYNAKTQEPIPYVNVSFLNTLKGASTDEKGYFFVDVPTSFLEKKVHLSSLGFKDTIVDVKKIVADKKFGMVEESFELDEVVVAKSLGDSYVLNPIGSYDLKSGFSSSSTPWVLATYYPNIGASKKYVNKVTVFFQKNEGFKRRASKFRIRVYDVDPVTKKPTKDLLHKSIILETFAENDFVSIDLSAFNIKMPKQGLYIGLEWLFVPYNWYAIKGKDPLTSKLTIEDRFAPTFGGVYNKNQNFKVMVYGMGEWTDFKVKSKDNTKHLVPALSLKLSKEKQ